MKKKHTKVFKESHCKELSYFLFVLPRSFAKSWGLPKSYKMVRNPWTVARPTTEKEFANNVSVNQELTLDVQRRSINALVLTKKIVKLSGCVMQMTAGHPP